MSTIIATDPGRRAACWSVVNALDRPSGVSSCHASNDSPDGLKGNAKLLGLSSLCELSIFATQQTEQLCRL